MIGFGHQWKLVRDWICSRCSARATHRWAIFASSSSIVATCWLTMGSSTSVQRVLAHQNVFRTDAGVFGQKFRDVREQRFLLLGAAGVVDRDLNDHEIVVAGDP